MTLQITTYKLTNIEIKLIESPIILSFPDGADGQRNLFDNCLELANTAFTRKYEINTVRARTDGMIEIGLSVPETERAQMKDETAADKTVSFF